MSEKVEHKPEREHHEPRTERMEHAPERREERPRVERPRGQIPPDTVFIGKKPLMAYATAVMMHFNSGQNTLTVKARGQSISHAVDVENSRLKMSGSPRKCLERKETRETYRRSRLS